MCVHTYTYIHMCVHTYTWIHIWIHACTYIDTAKRAQREKGSYTLKVSMSCRVFHTHTYHVCVHEYTCVYIHTHVRTYIQTCMTYIYTAEREREAAVSWRSRWIASHFIYTKCVYACIYMCVHIHKSVQYIQTCVYIRIYHRERDGNNVEKSMSCFTFQTYTRHVCVHTIYVCTYVHSVHTCVYIHVCTYIYPFARERQ